MAFASKVLLGAHMKPKETHPIDYIYNALQINMEYIDEGDEYELIKRYVDQTCHN